MIKQKTQALVDRFAGILATWDCVECITLNEAAIGDTNDPYFALILDVFVSEPPPLPETRCRLFGPDVLAFESASPEAKDRFLIGDIPVRLEYKPVSKIDELVSIADRRTDMLWLIRHSGTYTFYRLAFGDLVFSRSGWIGGIRERLARLPDIFWQQMRQAAQSKMEHFLSDLGAAAFQGDQFHYLLASAGFIKTACLTLFCANARFEPSHRAYQKQILQLPLLPEGFAAQLDNFFGTEAELPLERRFALAKLLAKGIVALRP